MPASKSTASASSTGFRLFVFTLLTLLLGGAAHADRPRVLILPFTGPDGRRCEDVVRQTLEGNVILVEGNPVVVVKAQYNKSGRNAAVIKVRAKNLMTNRISGLHSKGVRPVCR